MESGPDKPTAALLITEQYQAVYRFAFRLSRSQADAEDLTQQTFLLACRKLDDLRETDKARSWLFTIVRNLYLRSRRSADPPSIALEDVGEPAANGQLEGDIDREQLQSALDELPETYRIPLLLYYFEDLPYKEIATILNVPIGTVMSRLARGKETLRQRLSPVESTPHSPTPGSLP